MIALDKERMRPFLDLAEALRIRVLADPAFRARIDEDLACVPFVLACGAAALALWLPETSFYSDSPDVMVWAQVEDGIYGEFDCAFCCLTSFGAFSAMIAATLRDMAGLPDVYRPSTATRSTLRHDPMGGQSRLGIRGCN